MSDLVLWMGVIAIVLTVSALASGIVERAPLSFPLIFLGLGFLLGEGGLGIISISPYDQILEVVSIVSLSLVLFLDAVKFEIEELRSEWHIPVLTLGPGTLIVIGVYAGGAMLLLNTTLLQSLLLGAILASTDPVVLRDVLRDERIPRSVRRVLGLEAGISDVVLLPIVLILIAVLRADAGSIESWLVFLLRLLVLSPLVGLIVGGIGAYLIGKADARFGIRREYQALYGIGMVLAAYAAGQAVMGDGFLAAFFAGLGVAVFNVSLCDCFMEYGEVTAEMMMLLAFVLFGAVLSTLLGTIDLLPAFILAIIGLAIARPLAMWIVLYRAKMSRSARLFIGWFGPRGLDSLLLALLVVQAGVEGGERILAITGAVVVVSVILHGTTSTPLSAWYGRRVAAARQTFEEERESTFTGLFQPSPDEITRLSVDDLAKLMESGKQPIVLDVRSRNHYEHDAGQIPGSIRVLPDQIAGWEPDSHPGERLIVAYCTCPDEASSGRVARHLRGQGYQAAALLGGYKAWEAKHTIEAKGTLSLSNLGIMPTLTKPS